MKKVIVQLLEDAQVFHKHQMYKTMSLEIQDDNRITHGERHHEIVIQIEKVENGIRFLIENQHTGRREWFFTSQEEWLRLQNAPDWQHVSWFPFIAYERMTRRGKATLTRREDPLLRTRPDLLSSEFWQARLYLAKGILTTFTEFSCPAGRDDAFCRASEWTVQVEDGKYSPILSIGSSVNERSGKFRVTEGAAIAHNIWRISSKNEIESLARQNERVSGHSTILIQDLQTLKALLPTTKIAGEHSPTGLPLH